MIRVFFYAAAFGRLCVETLIAGFHVADEGAAAFGRLCVETMSKDEFNCNLVAAAFGRLCVETWYILTFGLVAIAAAFGRLCVETVNNCTERKNDRKQPPSGGCVLKPFSAPARLGGVCSRLRAAVC